MPKLLDFKSAGVYLGVSPWTVFTLEERWYADERGTSRWP